MINKAGMLSTLATSFALAAVTNAAVAQQVSVDMGDLAEAPQSLSYEDGIIAVGEIASYKSVENDADEPITLDGKQLYVAETTDGHEVYGTSSSGYKDGPSVRGLDKEVLLNDDGEPLTLDEVKKLDGVEGFPPPQEPEELETVAAPETAVAAPETAVAELENDPLSFVGTAFEDGQITAAEVVKYSHLPGLTKEQAETYAASLEDGSVSVAGAIENISFKKDGENFGITIGGKVPVTIIDSAGKAFCGATTSGYADGVTVRGLDNGIFNTADTGPATCEDLLKIPGLSN